MLHLRRSCRLLLLGVASALLLLVLLLLLIPRPASAAAFVVTTTGDGGDADLNDGICSAAGGGCTLRAAVEQANVLPGYDSITFNLSAYPATIAVGAQIVISGDLALTGPGASALTLSGGGLNRIFAIEGGTVEIENLTLTAGNTNSKGGAIYVAPVHSAASLYLTGVIAEYNNAFAGGAFYAEQALLWATASEIRYNAAGRGGGVYNDRGAVQLEATNLEHNFASERGGGLYHYRPPGGSWSVTFIVGSSRVRYNEASGSHPYGRGGGVYNDGGYVGFTDSFLEENVATTAATGCHGVYNTPGGSGGGLYGERGTVNLTDSTVYSNTARVTGACSGAGQPEMGWGGGLYLSRTHSLLSGAVFDRNTADWAGAIRAGSQSTLTVRTGTFTANVAGDGYGGALFSDGRLVVERTLFQDNSADGSFGVGGGGAVHARGDSAVISTTTFFSNTSRFGGAVDNEADSLRIADSTFAYNRSWTVNGCGGALFSSFATAHIVDTTFHHNRADDLGPGAGGGAICNEGTMTVLSSTLQANTAARYGGAIRNAGSLQLLSSDLLDNQATNPATSESSGGALFSVDGFGAGSAVVANSTLSGNSAGDYGGGILNRRRSVLTVSHSTLADNVAGLDGAGVYQDAGLAPAAATVVNSTLSGNDAGGVGGGIYANEGRLALKHATLWANSATGKGAGGLHTSITGTITATHSIVAHNSALVSGLDCVGSVLVPAGVRNLASDTSCAGFTFQSEDPLLNPLVDNGGATETHALRGDSPARARALLADCTSVDQRGVARSSYLVCDLGAYERTETEVCTDSAPINVGPQGFGQDTVTLPAAGPIVDVDIFVEINHSYVGNLVSFVEHGGDSVTLFNPAGGTGCSGDNIKALLDDEEIYSINSECSASIPTISGTFSPYEPLAAFDGLAATGNWDLGLDNQDLTQMATIANWCVRADAFSCAPPSPIDPAISIASGPRVRLDWLPGHTASHTLIYRSLTPYFTPAGSPYAASSLSTWDDPAPATIGDVDHNYYYLVRPASPCRLGPAGQRVGEFDFALVPGS